ncbi:MAG: hypothetical protein QOF48_1966 [Verrucomicrobiota bacterium]|jgi:hypothetical protein
MKHMKTKLCLLTLLATQVSFTPIRAADGLIAHEWGTFTSVQGADGIQLEWNPLVTSELPAFVYDASKRLASLPAVRAFGGKDTFVTRQRMETPVIYFYSDREMEVDVTVDFPQGIVTEWFPQATQGIPATAKAPARSSRSLIRWDHVQVLPLSQHGSLSDSLPFEKSGSHYYAARATDADFLRIDAAAKGGKAETEKFLFYRGIGNFTAPLTLTQGADGESFTVQNNGKEPLGNLFLYTVRGDRARHIYLDSLAPGATKTLKLDAAQNFIPLSEARASISGQLREALVREGLYAREASAMVQTWDDSWFTETGTRVLYTLPRAWTDRVLPLTVQPKPREVVRVMVGRAEAITPSMEWDLLKQVVYYSDGDVAARSRAVEAARNLGLGRFMEPTTRRLLAKEPVGEFSKQAWELLQAASKPASKSLAAR